MEEHSCLWKTQVDRLAETVKEKIRAARAMKNPELSRYYKFGPCLDCNPDEKDCDYNPQNKQRTETR